MSQTAESRRLAAANANKSVKINTILHHHKSPGAMKVLDQIARENGGVFKFVEAE